MVVALDDPKSGLLGNPSARSRRCAGVKISGHVMKHVVKEFWRVNKLEGLGFVARRRTRWPPRLLGFWPKN